MGEATDSYDRVRSRMLDLARSGNSLDVVVPSCPDWSVHDLIVHCMSLPVAIGAGDLPDGDPNGWIDGLIRSHEGRSIDEIEELWIGADPTIAGMLDGGMTLLLDDLAVHEHDMRGALVMPDHSALDIDLAVAGAVSALEGRLTEAGLGSIEVRCAGSAWRSHDAEPTWIIETDPWEAVRALFSRRTADELRALGGSADIDAHIAVVAAHLPLPETSLREP